MSKLIQGFNGGETCQSQQAKGQGTRDKGQGTRDKGQAVCYADCVPIRYGSMLLLQVLALDH